MMKNILFGALVAFLVFGFVLPVFALQNTVTSQQNTNAEKDVKTVQQNQTQVQTQNQGEEQQVQNNEQVQSNTQVQVQAQTKVQIKEQAKAVNGEEHRSTVANFVQNLLNVADREKSGIGEQVRVIAQEQEQNKEKTADSIEAIQKRNKIKTFLIGTDYKNVGALRSEMVQVRNRIDQLTRLTEQAKTPEDKTVLEEQVQIMGQEEININAFLKVNESKFSLFGWFVRLFKK